MRKKSITASIIAGAAVALFLPAVILFITPGIGSLLWLRESFYAQTAYTLLFFCSIIGIVFCFVFSFFGYKIRKQVTQASAPTLGFRRSSHNGAFFTAVLLSLLFIFQIVILIGYHVSIQSGYIANVIAKYEMTGKTASLDVIGIIVAASFALSAAASWTYYFYTFFVNRTMQLVMPDSDKPLPDDAPAVPSKEDAEKHRPKSDDDSPRPTFGLSDEEKELGKQEFEDK